MQSKAANAVYTEYFSTWLQSFSNQKNKKLGTSFPKVKLVPKGVPLEVLSQSKTVYRRKTSMFFQLAFSAQHLVPCLQLNKPLACNLLVNELVKPCSDG